MGEVAGEGPRDTPILDRCQMAQHGVGQRAQEYGACRMRYLTTRGKPTEKERLGGGRCGGGSD